MSIMKLRIFQHPGAEPSYAVCCDPMTLISGALTIGSTIIGVIGQQQEAKAQEQALNYESGALRQQAQAQIGASSYEATQRVRQATLAQQRLQAVAAASGGGATDPTVLKEEGRIAGQGEYNKLMTLASGENRARGLTEQASLDQYEAGQISAASGWRTAGSILGGGASFFSKYGAGLFNSSGSSGSSSSSGLGFTPGFAGSSGPISYAGYSFGPIH